MSGFGVRSALSTSWAPTVIQIVSHRITVTSSAKKEATMTHATVRIAGDVDDRNIDRYELESARRALHQIKVNLGAERLHELVSKQVDAGNDLFRDHVARSSGETATGTTVIELNGLSAAEFSRWMINAFAREDVLIDAQPEHYLMKMGDPNGPHVVETLGDHIVGFYMQGWDASEIEDTADTDRRHSYLKLDDDGTIFGSVSTAFLETDSGMRAELSVTLPATSAPDAVDQHLQHFSVEFRSWMLKAATESSATA